MKVLIVGGGSIGERHLRCFQQVMDGEVALCEPFDERRHDVSTRYGLAQSFATLEQAADQSWDCAVICTPAHLHVDHALTLLPAVKSLMIEKPLATRIEDAQRLAPACQGRIVNIAYVLRASAAVQQVKQLLDSGELGKLLEVTVVSGQHFPTYRPAYREIYYRDRATGGGAIQDAATHTFNLVQYFAGNFDWVFCDYEHLALEGVDVEDTVHLTARCNRRQVLVSLALNQFMAPNETRVSLNCQQGSIQLWMPEHRWGVLRHGEADWHWHEPATMERDDLFRRQATAFLQSSTEGRPVLCSFDEAIHTLKVNLAALRSAGEKRVEID